jgi:hypothetical protein
LVILNCRRLNSLALHDRRARAERGQIRGGWNLTWTGQWVVMGFMFGGHILVLWLPSGWRFSASLRENDHATNAPEKVGAKLLILPRLQPGAQKRDDRLPTVSTVSEMCDFDRAWLNWRKGKPLKRLRLIGRLRPPG